jgi:D-sedoheptulose 7-phosphate isomerase
VGFLGFDGGKLRKVVDECLWIPTEKGAYGLVESAHSLLCHIVTTCLMQSHTTDSNRSLENQPGDAT